jgi:hypothetical protein
LLGLSFDKLATYQAYSIWIASLLRPDMIFRRDKYLATTILVALIVWAVLGLLMQES